MTVECYQQVNGTIVNAGEVPCGTTNSSTPFVPCCVSAGICLIDSMCQSTHSVVGGSGYYVGGCTDPTFQDPSCKKRCTNDQILPDATYNSNRDLWQCCGDSASGTPHCANPTTETFLAPAPDDLIAYYTPSTANRTTSTSSSSSTSPTTSATPTIATSTDHKTGLSTGAIAGLAVGLSILAIALLALLALCLYRRRKRQHHPTSAAPLDPKYSDAELPVTSAAGGSSPMMSHAAKTPQLPALFEHRGSEAGLGGSGTSPAELDAHEVPAELPESGGIHRVG